MVSKLCFYGATPVFCKLYYTASYYQTVWAFLKYNIYVLKLLDSERPKLYRVYVVLSAIGLTDRIELHFVSLTEDGVLLNVARKSKHCHTFILISDYRLTVIFHRHFQRFVKTNTAYCHRFIALSIG